MSGAALALVVKLGGEVVGAARLGGIARDLAALVAAGHRVVVVHGGGPQATELQRRLGLTPTIVAGRRVTDEATLEVMKMVLAGKVNVDLCAALRRAGVRPVGLHGAVAAERRPPRPLAGAGEAPIDLGLVGDVTGCDLPLLELLIAAGYLPVVACLGVGAGGAVYNINADVVGSRLAAALAADYLVLVTSVDGVRSQADDPSTRLPVLSAAAGRAAIADGRIRGGMIPKVEECIAALADGVKRVLIVEGDVARAVASPGSAGTIVEP